MNRPFCLSCGCIKESIQRDYCDDCVKSLVEELTALRQRVSELEAQVVEQVACRAALSRELTREQKRLKRRDAERDALQETVDRQLDQLAVANEKVRVLREYAEAEEYYFEFDGPAGCKAAEPYDGPCECWKPRLEALNAQRRVALEATKEREL